MLKLVFSLSIFISVK